MSRRTAFQDHTLFSFFVPLMFIALVSAGVSGCDNDDDDDASGEAGDGETTPDPDCDALLTPADFADVCGAELTLEPTAFEGIELNPCNRTAQNNEALLLVSRHPDAATATRGADVAGGRGPTAQESLGLQASAGSAGVFVIEVKARDDASAVCAPDRLPMLLDIALERVLP